MLYEVVESPPQADSTDHEMVWFNESLDRLMHSVADECETGSVCRTRLVELCRACNQLLDHSGETLTVRTMDALRRLDQEACELPDVCTRGRAVLIFWSLPEYTLSHPHREDICVDMPETLVRMELRRDGSLSCCSAIPSVVDWDDFDEHGYTQAMLDAGARDLTREDMVWHPHVSREGTVCLGSSSDPDTALPLIQDALQQGLLSLAMQLVSNTLRTYNPASPYARLEAWAWEECPNCTCVAEPVTTVGGSDGCVECCLKWRDVWLLPGEEGAADCCYCSSTYPAEETVEIPRFDIMWSDEHGSYYMEPSDPYTCCGSVRCRERLMSQTARELTTHPTLDQLNRTPEENIRHAQAIIESASNPDPARMEQAPLDA